MNGARGLVIAILAAFIVGCSAGVLGGILFTRFVLGPGPPMPGFLLHPGRPRPGPGPVQLELERRLDLTPEQRERVEAIVESSRLRYMAVRESTHAALVRELTPAQRERWRQMEERFMRERRPPFGHGPWHMDRP